MDNLNLIYKRIYIFKKKFVKVKFLKFCDSLDSDSMFAAI